MVNLTVKKEPVVKQYHGACVHKGVQKLCLLIATRCPTSFRLPNYRVVVVEQRDERGKGRTIESCLVHVSEQPRNISIIPNPSK